MKRTLGVGTIAIGLLLASVVRGQEGAPTTLEFSFTVVVAQAGRIGGAVGIVAVGGGVAVVVKAVRTGRVGHLAGGRRAAVLGAVALVFPWVCWQPAPGRAALLPRSPARRARALCIYQR
jgi:hypothetical protein